MNKTSKALFTLLVLLGTKGYSKEKLISVDSLKENKIDPIIVNLLLAEDVLLKLRDLNFYRLNEKKVDELLTKNPAPELVEFMNWLKSIVGDETQTNQKDPGGMTISTQDFKSEM